MFRGAESGLFGQGTRAHANRDAIYISRGQLSSCLFSLPATVDVAYFSASYCKRGTLVSQFCEDYHG